MSPKEIFLILVMAIAAFQACFGQEKPKAELVVEVSSIGGCENYWSALDVLFTELLDEPDSVGYVVIKSNKADVIRKIIYKEWAYNHFKFRKFDKRLKRINESQFLVVSGEDSPELEIQLWKVPSVSEKPFKFNENFNYLLELKKPQILFDRGFDGGGLCPAIDYEKVYLDFLKNNSDLNGNVVFYENSKNRFLKMKNEFLKENDGVSQNRLRFFRSPNIYDGWEGYYEFWLVPQKKR